MNWNKLKEKFPNSSKEIREHLSKTGISNSRALIEDFLRSKGYNVGIMFIGDLQDYENKTTQSENKYNNT